MNANVFISSSFLKDVFTGHRTLGKSLLFFSVLSMASTIFAVKSIVSFTSAS